MHGKAREYVPVGTTAPKLVFVLGVSVALCGCASQPAPLAAQAPADRSLLPLSAREEHREVGASHSSSATLEAPAEARASGSWEAPSWLGPREVGRAVRAHGPAFTACHTLADAATRRLDGAVTVGWLVEPDGRTDDVTVGPSTFESREVNACVLSVARRVRFPATLAPTRVSWTVRFRAAADGSLANARSTLP